MNPARVRLGLLQVCLAGVLWGTGGLVVTLLHERDGWGAMTASSWRMGLAAVALVAFAGLSGRNRAVTETLRRHPVRASLVGIGTAAYQGLYFLAVLQVGVGVATVVALGLAPILTATWEHLRARTRPNVRETAVLVAALAGLLLISLTADGSGGETIGDGNAALGLALAVTAGVLYAATTVLGHDLAQRGDPIALATVATTAGAVVLLPFLVLAAGRDEPVLVDSAESWLLVLYLGVATLALAYALLYAGLRSVRGSAATVATLVEPLSAAALAAVLLDERIAPLGLLGAALILVAVAALRPEEPATV